MSDLRIAHVCWSGATGGVENFAFDLCHELAQRGDVALCWAAHGAGRETGDTPASLAIEAFHMHSGFDLRRFASLTRWLGHYQPDVIHIHQTLALAPWLNRQCPAARQIYHFHTLAADYYPHRMARHNLGLTLGRSRIDRFVANSNATRVRLARILRNDGTAVSVLPNGFDLTHFQRTPPPDTVRREFDIPDDAHVVGTVARLHHVKGVDDFLRVAAAIRVDQPDTMFIITGGGPEERALQQQAQKLGLGRNVRFVGERCDIARILSTLDVFLCTSRVETFGLATAEAMALGVPVVSFAVDALPELIGDDGYLVPAGDIVKAAVQVRAALNHPEQAQERSARAATRVRREYEIKTVAKRFSEFYEEVAQEAPTDC